MAQFTVQRETVVDAPPDAVLPFLVDLRRWQQWSPWEGLDPALERSYGGAPTGVGATYAWSGNRKAGRGSMRITEVRPDASVTLDLVFDKPFRAHNTTAFLLSDQAGRTRVTWRMTGPTPLPMRLLSAFLSMDKLVGGDFEKGLTSLRAAVEAR